LIFKIKLARSTFIIKDASGSIAGCGNGQEGPFSAQSKLKLHQKLKILEKELNYLVEAIIALKDS
jgi:hypothetical protein